MSVNVYVSDVSLSNWLAWGFVTFFLVFSILFKNFKLL